MQRSFECSVCSDFYLPGTRPPKTLSCGHSFCAPCLHILYKDSTLNCPKCRTTCSLPDGKIENLPISFAILELLDSVCGECHNQPHDGKCSHCDKDVCGACRDIHTTTAQVDSSSDYDTLKTLVSRLTDKLADDTPLKAITTRRDRVISDLTEIRDDQIHLIERQFTERVTKVKDVTQEDIQQLLAHNGQIRSLLAEANTLLDNIQKRYYLGTNTEDPSLKRNSNRMAKLLNDLEKATLSTSTIDCSMDMNTFTADLSKSSQLMIYKKSDVSKGHPQYQFVPDYNLYKSKAICDVRFERICYVCVNPKTADFIVTDNSLNNRVHIVSHGLKPLVSFLPGKDTGGYILPRGVACDGDLIYIADYLNARVYVTDVQGNQVRAFGTKGSGRDNFDGPQGLALDSAGHLYVCDSGNHRVKVTNKEGFFLREFGQSIFDMYVPLFIAVSRDNKVAVTDNDNLYLFTTDGQHIRTIKSKTSPNIIYVNAAVFDSHGNLVVTDHSGQVVVMSETGEVRYVIGRQGYERGELLFPKGLAITPKGELAVCDQGNDRLQLFSAM